MGPQLARGRCPVHADRARGETNLGQHVRQRHVNSAFLIGCTTYEGTVTAASTWDAPAERKRLHPALTESYESLFHDAGLERSLLILQGRLRVAGLGEPRLLRTIGAIYHPDTERTSHYRRSCLTYQFDAVLHFDRTRAVEPLEPTTLWRKSERPETIRPPSEK